MASINAQTASSTNASECSAVLCQSESRSSEKTASPVAIEAKSFEFAYPPSEDPQAPRTSIGPLDWRVPQGRSSCLSARPVAAKPRFRATANPRSPRMANAPESLPCSASLQASSMIGNPHRSSATCRKTPRTRYATEAVCMDGGRLRPISLSEFDAQPLIPQPCPSRNVDAPVCITVSDAYCRYERTSDWVLRGFDLRVAQGSIHALIGGNGCGKSTLLRVIAGVQKLDRGACVNVLAQRQALLPQDPKGLFVCDTVQEELSEWQHACGYADADVDAIAQAFGLAERLSNHPYDLSGGQQQQLLALAKLLLTKSSLLLLDELTKGLDPQTKCQVTKAIQEQARAGVTVVMATHDLPFAALVADEATMLFDGESAATQPAPEFFADNLFYRPACDSFAKQWLENEADR